MKIVHTFTCGLTEIPSTVVEDENGKQICLDSDDPIVLKIKKEEL